MSLFLFILKTHPNSDQSNQANTAANQVPTICSKTCQTKQGSAPPQGCATLQSSDNTDDNACFDAVVTTMATTMIKARYTCEPALL
jgi:hypothetical protein